MFEKQNNFRTPKEGLCRPQKSQYLNLEVHVMLSLCAKL